MGHYVLHFLCLVALSSVNLVNSTINEDEEPRRTFPFRRAIDGTRGRKYYVAGEDGFFDYGSSRGQYDSYEDETDFSDIRNNVPGEPGVDYPSYTTLPQTSWVCQDDFAGYYADESAGCQVFHVCDGNFLVSSFLCPIGSVFSQKLLTCDWWNKVDCSSTQNYYTTKASTSDVSESSDDGILATRYEENRGKSVTERVASSSTTIDDRREDRRNGVSNYVTTATERVNDLVNIQENYPDYPDYTSRYSPRAKPISGKRNRHRYQDEDYYAQDLENDEKQRTDDENPMIRVHVIGDDRKNDRQNFYRNDLPVSFAPTVPTLTTSNRRYSPTIATTYRPFVNRATSGRDDLEYESSDHLYTARGRNEETVKAATPPSFSRKNRPKSVDRPEFVEHDDDIDRRIVGNAETDTIDRKIDSSIGHANTDRKIGTKIDYASTDRKIGTKADYASIDRKIGTKIDHASTDRKIGSKIEEPIVPWRKNFTTILNADETLASLDAKEKAIDRDLDRLTEKITDTLSILKIDDDHRDPSAYSYRGDFDHTNEKSTKTFGEPSNDVNSTISIDSRGIDRPAEFLQPPQQFRIMVLDKNSTRTHEDFSKPETTGPLLTTGSGKKNRTLGSKANRIAHPFTDDEDIKESRIIRIFVNGNVTNKDSTLVSQNHQHLKNSTTDSSNLHNSKNSTVDSKNLQSYKNSTVDLKNPRSHKNSTVDSKDSSNKQNSTVDSKNLSSYENSTVDLKNIKNNENSAVDSKNIQSKQNSTVDLMNLQNYKNSTVVSKDSQNYRNSTVDLNDPQIYKNSTEDSKNPQNYKNSTVDPKNPQNNENSTVDSNNLKNLKNSTVDSKNHPNYKNSMVDSTNLRNHANSTVESKILRDHKNSTVDTENLENNENSTEFLNNSKIVANSTGDLKNVGVSIETVRSIDLSPSVDEKYISDKKVDEKISDKPEFSKLNGTTMKSLKFSKIGSNSTTLEAVEKSPILKMNDEIPRDLDIEESRVAKKAIVNDAIAIASRENSDFKRSAEDIPTIEGEIGDSLQLGSSPYQVTLTVDKNDELDPNGEVIRKLLAEQGDTIGGGDLKNFEIVKSTEPQFSHENSQNNFPLDEKIVEDHRSIDDTYTDNYQNFQTNRLQSANYLRSLVALVNGSNLPRPFSLKNPRDVETKTADDDVDESAEKIVINVTTRAPITTTTETIVSGTDVMADFEKSRETLDVASSGLIVPNDREISGRSTRTFGDKIRKTTTEKLIFDLPETARRHDFQTGETSRDSHESKIPIGEEIANERFNETANMADEGKIVVETEFIPSLGFSLNTEEERKHYMQAVMKGLLHDITADKTTNNETNTSMES